MMWFLGALGVAIIACGMFLASGRLGQMPDVIDDHPVPRLPEGDFSADDVAQLRFAVTFRGYSSSEVDDLLDRILATMKGDGRTPPVGGADLRTARFLVARQGYHMGQVDEVLDRLAHQLDERSLVVTGPGPETPGVSPRTEDAE